MCDVNETKIESIYRCLKLGMAAEEAYILAECTAEEQEALSKNQEFQALASFHKAAKEHELMQKLDRLIETNVAAGKGEDLRWLLGKLNRKRYGDGKGEDDNTELAKKALGVAENLTASARMAEFERIRAEATRQL